MDSTHFCKSDPSLCSRLETRTDFYTILEQERVVAVNGQANGVNGKE